jgi:regulator of protease activity HflC (stomatin/prohibitin superfamily)
MSMSAVQLPQSAVSPGQSKPGAGPAPAKKKGTNVKGLLLLGLAFLVVVPPIYWFISWQLAWFLLLATPVIAYLLFLDRGLSRVFFYSFGIFVVALITATVLQIALAENTAALEDSAILSFFLGGDDLAFGKQLLFAVVGGALAGLTVVNLPLLAVMYASSEWVLAEAGATGVDRKMAFRLLWSVIMNTQYPWLIVEGGTVTESKPKGVLPRLGGPGNVVIRPGNAVVFERRGEITRVAGPGVVQTKRFELIRQVVELKPKWASATLENVLTKDRIPLTMTFGVGFQLEPKSEVDKRSPLRVKPGGVQPPLVISDGVYEVYESSIRKAVFDTAANWELTTFAVGENLLRDTVATYYFDQIYKRKGESIDKDVPGPFNPVERTMKQIEDSIYAEQSRLAASWGAHIRSVDIKAVQLPEEAQEQMIDWWRAKWRRLIALEEAETLREQLERRGAGEAKLIEAIELARSQKQQALIDSLTASVKKIQSELSTGQPELAVRLLEVMERLSRALSATDTSTTVRYVEALEHMAADSGTKVLMIGEHRELLPPIARGDEGGRPGKGRPGP